MPSPTADRFNLLRFIDAQDAILERVETELAQARKESHWMWFVFPQVDGLGSSPTARKYAIGSLGEAQAYLAHPILGARLRKHTQTVVVAPERTAEEIFGGIDALKFHSSMTLFHAVSAEGVFAEALGRFFDGASDDATMAWLRKRRPDQEARNPSLMSDPGV